MSFDETGFKESEHPRGQPKYSGQFAKAPGGGGKGQEKSGEKGSEGAEKKSGASTVAIREHQIAGAVELSNHLKMLSRVQGTAKGKSPAQFLVENGQAYVVNDKTYEGPRDPMHECYKNATLAALSNKDRTYVEGFITISGVPIEHAWTVDSTGQVFDSTVKPSMQIGGYVGVPFKTDYVLAAGLLNKKYGLLGRESMKSLEPLLKGDASEFKQVDDPDKLAPSVIADRLAYVDALVRTIQPTDKIDTPERKEMRKKITEDLYNENIEKRSRNREATIILGLPGSGKSTFANPLLDKGALEIDPDLAKAKIPEFEGGRGAFAVHEESSAITRDIFQKALTNGDDFVWPRIDSPDKMIKDIKSLKDAGYKVNVKFIDADPKVAMKNAISRFVKTGRYVSLDTISSYGDSPRESYEAAKASGLIDGHESYKHQSGGNGFARIEEK